VIYVLVVLSSGMSYYFVLRCAVNEVLRSCVSSFVAALPTVQVGDTLVDISVTLMRAYQ
jgi:hypothetical protein